MGEEVLLQDLGQVLNFMSLSKAAKWSHFKGTDVRNLENKSQILQNIHSSPFLFTVP